MNRRRGCIGYAVPTWCDYRAEPGGPVTRRLALICDRCGQAHGPARGDQLDQDGR